ncbi:metal-dependent hydrolase [Streptomyces cinnamoneus]|uniref:Metal-dependent hydrolase n=1 Tax=Streptomyces cinnamoneus TaxID=53446 RepID=A0A918TS04_STRCJ|nr:metal-dependent hydrolase [Streptomyces cinnamoneus]GHC60661.1 hypothetical protein GCM10010507_42080 [Streptomyces cinnamoneus]
MQQHAGSARDMGEAGHAPTAPGAGDPTHVTFPGGAVHGTSTVLAVVPVDGRTAVITGQTPFHPVDHTWPDHPADRGSITVAGRRHPVVDCLIGAVEAGGPGTGTLRAGSDIPVRRDAEGWRWLVLHMVEDFEPAAVGEPCELTVDAPHRHALSAGHTACHLASLALNEAVAGRWRKETAADVAGVPDFDGAALVTSRIHPYGSRDTYRLGKSLRRKGFTTEGLAEELPRIAEQVTARIEEWIARDVPVRIVAEGPGVTDRRWMCVGEGEGALRFACGGTHAASTGRLGAASVTFVLSEDGAQLVMETTVRQPDGAAPNS